MIKSARPAGRRGPTVVSNEAVFQCFVDLCGANPPIQATRQAVSDQLAVPFRIIDEHTDRLLRAGRLRRVLPGVFEPVGQVEVRAVTFTALPDGGGVLEIGDQVLNLRSMREGWAAYGQIEGWLRSKTRALRTATPPKE